MNANTTAQAVTGFPHRRPGFDPRSGQVGFVVKVALGAGIFRVAKLPLPILNPLTAPYSSIILSCYNGLQWRTYQVDSVSAHAVKNAICWASYVSSHSCDSSLFPRPINLFFRSKFTKHAKLPINFRCRQVYWYITVIGMSITQKDFFTPAFTTVTKPSLLRLSNSQVGQGELMWTTPNVSTPYFIILGKRTPGFWSNYVWHYIKDFHPMSELWDSSPSLTELLAISCPNEQLHSVWSILRSLLHQSHRRYSLLRTNVKMVETLSGCRVRPSTCSVLEEVWDLHKTMVCEYQSDSHWCRSRQTVCLNISVNAQKAKRHCFK
jgi:hypothetical protein